MDARTLLACAQNQQAAAVWFSKFVGWRDQAAAATYPPARMACLSFAIQDQEDAARLYAADRHLRLGQD